MPTLEVLFTPTEFAALKQRRLDQTVCVVFDVLRATSSMVTALANGAVRIIPVAEIPEALAVRKAQPEVLLAGERDGIRIPAKLAGGVDFDLGNSPREFSKEVVSGRTLVMSTTNGTRALRACAHAQAVLAASFLNLRATVAHLQKQVPLDLLLVCSGTYEQAAYEDVLGAGALCDILWSRFGSNEIADSALLARKLYQLEQDDLPAALAHSRNGRRLLAHPALSEDVAFCAQRDRFDLVAELDKDGCVRRTS